MTSRKLFGIAAIVILVAAAGGLYAWHRHQERFSAQTDLNIKNFVTKGPSWYTSGHRVEKVKTQAE
ncbi:hypothetical protein [Brucella pituitosa]|uniref:hypothetical protein n=1 Tax=Brucella pituitosa TaxID=571256 RepID=UPI0009A16717|nr:hypothetical protein [Brucella pituitosa]